MPEIPTLKPLELQEPKGPLFFSPKIRKETEETKARSEMLHGTIHDDLTFPTRKGDLIGFEELAGDDEIVTLGDFFRAAERAVKKNDRATLVALKRFGQSLLEKMYPEGGDRTSASWEWDFGDDPERRYKIRAAEMIILKAEMEYLELRRREGTFDEIPQDKLTALQKQFRQYARNTDIPEEFRKSLRFVAANWNVVETFNEQAERIIGSVLEEEKSSQAETSTVAVKSSAAETRVDKAEKPTPETRKVLPIARTARYYELEPNEKDKVWLRIGPLMASSGEKPLTAEEWKLIKEYQPQAIEWCVRNGNLPEAYWKGALQLLVDSLPESSANDPLMRDLLKDIEQHLLYALHRNQRTGLKYWLLGWGWSDWVAQIRIQIDNFNLSDSYKVFGSSHAQNVRVARITIARAARAAIQKLSETGQELLPVQQIVVGLLRLISEEFETLYLYK